MVNKTKYRFLGFLRMAMLILIPFLFADNLILTYLDDSDVLMELAESEEKEESKDNDDTKEWEIDDFMQASANSNWRNNDQLTHCREANLNSHLLSQDVVTPPPEEV